MAREYRYFVTIWRVPDADYSGFERGIEMKVLEDKNTVVNTTLVTDENGAVVFELIRKYGPAISTADALELEKTLVGVTSGLVDQLA